MAKRSTYRTLAEAAAHCGAERCPLSWIREAQGGAGFYVERPKRGSGRKPSEAVRKAARKPKRPPSKKDIAAASVAAPKLVAGRAAALRALDATRGSRTDKTHKAAAVKALRAGGMDRHTAIAWADQLLPEWKKKPAAKKKPGRPSGLDQDKLTAADAQRALKASGGKIAGAADYLRKHHRVTAHYAHRAVQQEAALQKRKRDQENYEREMKAARKRPKRSQGPVQAIVFRNAPFHVYEDDNAWGHRFAVKNEQGFNVANVETLQKAKAKIVALKKNLKKTAKKEKPSDFGLPPRTGLWAGFTPAALLGGFKLKMPLKGETDPHGLEMMKRLIDMDVRGVTAMTRPELLRAFKKAHPGVKGRDVMAAFEKQKKKKKQKKKQKKPDVSSEVSKRGVVFQTGTTEVEDTGKELAWRKRFTVLLRGGDPTVTYSSHKTLPQAKAAAKRLDQKFPREGDWFKTVTSEYKSVGNKREASRVIESPRRAGGDQMVTFEREGMFGAKPIRFKIAVSTVLFDATKMKEPPKSVWKGANPMKARTKIDHAPSARRKRQTAVNSELQRLRMMGFTEERGTHMKEVKALADEQVMLEEAHLAGAHRGGAGVEAWARQMGWW